MAALKVVTNSDAEKEAQRRRDIDRYGQLNNEYLLWKPRETELAALSKKLQGYAAEQPADQMAVLDGNTWQVQLGMRENKRTITNSKKAFDLLKKYAGIEALIKLVKIPLKEGVDRYIPKEEHKNFLTEDRTGTRDIVAVVLRQTPANVA